MTSSTRPASLPASTTSDRHRQQPQRESQQRHAPRVLYAAQGSVPAPSHPASRRASGQANAGTQVPFCEAGKVHALDPPVDHVKQVGAMNRRPQQSRAQEALGACNLSGRLDELTPRELEVLALMAQGRTDRGIREALWVSQKTVEAHVRNIFRKLDLPRTPWENRRVHAVLIFFSRSSDTPM